MKELGVKVLTKIENLISVIEKKPKTKAGRQMEQENLAQQMSDHTQYLRRLSYSFIEKKEKRHQKFKQWVYKQEQRYEPFRISNITTKQILKKKNMKPIHQRSHEIMINKMNKIQQLQTESFIKQQEQLIPFNQQLEDQNQNKSKFIQLGQLRQEIDYKNHNRIKKKHFLQLKNVKKQIYSGIPQIATSSRSLSKIYNQKKRLSDNVFLRLSQDYIDRNRRKKELAQKTERQQGGFSPSLCQKSRTLVSGRAKKYEIQPQKYTESPSHKKCKQIPVWNSWRKSNGQFSMMNPQISNSKANPHEGEGETIKINLSKSIINYKKPQINKSRISVSPQKQKRKQLGKKNQAKQIDLSPSNLSGNKTRKVQPKKIAESTAVKRDNCFKQQ